MLSVKADPSWKGGHVHEVEYHEQNTFAKIACIKDHNFFERDLGIWSSCEVFWYDGQTEFNRYDFRMIYSV